MKSGSKSPSASAAVVRAKNNRVRLEKLLRQMLYSELSAAQESTFGKLGRGSVPYRRIIE